MSLEEEDDFWNRSDVKAFNFDDDEQAGTAISSSTSGYSNQATSANQPEIKTLGSVLAARPSSNEPFLKPSMILCNGDRIEALITYLDENLSRPPSKKHLQDPKSHIRDIIEKKVPIEFSQYKSKRDKLLLLDCAICSLDGNTIIAASIFLAQTLKQSIFIEEIKKRPTAVDHYLNYLEMTGKTREANELNAKLSN